MGKYNKTKNIASSLEENKNKKIISKKGLRKIFYKIKYISPLSFNNKQIFYFEITKMIKLVEAKEPIDLLKLNNEDIKLLDEEIKLLENRNSDCEKFLIINEQMANLINEWKSMKAKLLNEERLIKDILENSKDRISLSCRKISVMIFLGPPRGGAQKKIKIFILNGPGGPKKSKFSSLFNIIKS